MPSLLTHYFFANDCLKEARNQVIERYPSVFALGSQGPDPMFFSSLIPFMAFSIKAIKGRYGSKLHRLDGKELFFESLKTIEDIEDLLSKEVFMSFIFGQLAHYTLDSICHPYVYYFTGFDKNSKLSGKLHYAHSHFEGRIDSAMASNFNRKDLISKPSDVLKIKEEYLDIINSYFNATLERIFKTSLPKNYYKSGVKNMIRVYNFVNDNEFFGSHLGKNTLGQLFIPRHDDGKVLNEDHHLWKNPYSGVVSKESFLQLYTKALKRFSIGESMLSTLDFNKVKNYFTGINYSGVLVGQKMKYYDENGVLLDHKVYVKKK